MERFAELCLSKALSLKVFCGMLEPKSCMKKKAMRVFICTIVCFCLIANIIFSAQYFYYYIQFQVEYTFSVRQNSLKIPYIVLEWIRNISQILYVTGIPLAFAANYFMTGRWRELKTIIQELHQEIAFPLPFYRRCKISCFVLTVMSLTVR